MPILSEAPNGMVMVRAKLGADQRGERVANPHPEPGENEPDDVEHQSHCVTATGR
jgi:hypothetical protein